MLLLYAPPSGAQEAPGHDQAPDKALTTIAPDDDTGQWPGMSVYRLSPSERFVTLEKVHVFCCHKTAHSLPKQHAIPQA